MGKRLGMNGRSPSQAPDQSRGDYIAGIDGLRAVAVLAVLAFHLDERLLPSGFVGVDLFFVISGFVVSMTTSGMDVASFGQLIRRFYRRRVIRILPASLIFLLVMELLAVLFIPTVELLEVSDMTAAAAAAGLGNIVLWRMAGDYFSPGVTLNPFTHMWSLGVEEQFYLLFPFFATGLFIRRDTELVRRLTLSALSLVAVLSFGLAAWRSATDQTFSFYMLPARLWELAAGVLLFAVLGERGAIRQFNSLNVTTLRIMSLLGTAFLAASFVSVSTAEFPFPGALLPTVGAVLLIAVVSLAPTSLISRVLSIRPLRYVGRISYSLYLWHWGVIVLMRWTSGLETAPQKLLAAVLSLVLADLSYRFVERSARASPWLARHRDSRILAFAAGGSVFTGLLIVAMVVGRPVLSLSVVARNGNIWRAAAQAHEGGCHVQRTKTGLPNDGILYQLTPLDCATPLSGHRLFVLGDSHAWGYQRLAGTVARNTNTTSMVYTAHGCRFASIYAGDTPSFDIQCSAFLEQSLLEIAKVAKPGDTLFLPGLRTQRYREYWETSFQKLKPANIYTTAMIQAAAEQLRPILDLGVNIVLEAPKPVYNFAPLRCADWFDRGNPHCHVPAISRDEALARRAPVMAVLGLIVAAEPRITLWDPFPVLCVDSANTCSPYRDGYPLVADGDHLTAYANDLLTPAFETLLFVRQPDTRGR